MRDVTDKVRAKERRSRPNALDRAIEFLAPEKAFRRQQARQALALTGGFNTRGAGPNRWRRGGRQDGSANAESLPYLASLRSETRDLMRRAPLATGAIKTVVTNVVGTGLYPVAMMDRDVILARTKLTESQIDRLEQEFEREFWRWAGRKGCDAALKVNFAAMQRLVLRAALESGDVFVIRRMLERGGFLYSTSLQVIEADRVVNPRGVPDRADCHGGVQRDNAGAAAGYHILKAHPGDRWMNTDRHDTAYLKAYADNGEWMVLHIMLMDRPEQTRGIPYLATVIDALRDLTRYAEAEIAAAVVSALFTVFVTSQDGDSSIPVSNAPRAAADQEKVELGNGSIVDLAANEKVEFANPSRPNQAFDPFVLSILRQIGVALEIPFEILVKHFTASYSAAQAALLEAWKFFRTMREWFVGEFCQPAYEALIFEAVASGIIDAPGFFTDPVLRDAYLQTEWTGPPRGMIDQLKEAKAAEIMEDRGWKTGQEITAEMTGGDWDVKHRRRVKEDKMRRESGLTNTPPEPLPTHPPQPEPEDEDID